MTEAPGYGGTQDRGRRPYQEDAFHIQPTPGPGGGPGSLLLLLADGMGGHSGGAHASAAAVEAFAQAYRAAPEGEPEAERLRRGLAAANGRIARDAAAGPALRGMGCTLLGASLTPAGLRWISVGDSPLFLFRDGALSRLNDDHSMAPVLEQAAQLGTLSREELACHPNRNALRSAVTGREISLVDLRDEPMELRPGDRLVAASDGLLTLAPERIGGVIGEHRDRTAEELSRALVEAVGKAENPHQDNVTVLIAAVPPAPAGTEVREASRSRPGAAALFPRLLQPRVLAAAGALSLVAAAAVYANNYGVFTRPSWPPWKAAVSEGVVPSEPAGPPQAARPGPPGETTQAESSGADSAPPAQPARPMPPAGGEGPQ